MAALTALAIGSLALGAAGLGTQMVGASKATSAAKSQYALQQQQAQMSSDFSQQEEGINQLSAAYQADASARSRVFNNAILQGQQDIQTQQFNAMNLDAQRKQLEVVRQAQRARSLALATATAQGANKGGTSALGGAYGQVAGQTNTNLQGIAQNLQIGKNIFGLNAGITNQRVGLNDLQDWLAQQQADLTTQKSQLIQQYAQKGADIQTLYAGYGSQLASAQGLSAIGSGMTQAAGTLFNAGMNFNKLFASDQIGAPLDITYGTNGFTPTPIGLPGQRAPGTNIYGIG